MSDQSLQLLAIVGGILLFALPIFILIRMSMKKKRIWRTFAEKNNLNLEEGRFPIASGEIDGREIAFSHGIGRTWSGRADLNRVAQFHAWVEIKGKVPEEFIAAKKGWAEGSGSLKPDNKLFNKKVRADCKDQAQGTAYLTPERQEMLLELIKFDGHVHGPFDSTKAYVVMDRPGYKVRDEWFEERKQILLKAAKVFDGE